MADENGGCCSNDMTTDDSLDQICDYAGPADDLPVGGYCKIPGWGPEKAAFRWKVQDAEEVAGWKLVKSSELTADSIIIGVILNKNTIVEIVNTYGENFIELRDANGGPWMTPAQWSERFHTDGVALVALRNKRYELQGPGVKVHRSPATHYGVDATKMPGSGQIRVDLGTCRKPVKLGRC